MPEERFKPGQQIYLYTLERKIDSGGMGEVWQASKPDRSRVAIKFPHRQFAHDQRFHELVRREAAAQLNLRHPNIVAAEAILEVDDLPAIVFAYVDGPNLERKIYGDVKSIDRGEPLPLRYALAVATQILAALDYAHQNCYVHRDVKSSNILLERNTDRALLTDFGIVLNVASQRLTRAGVVSGSVPYMSPEQITSPQSVNLRSDVYSFGVVLYEMLTGALPYRVEPGETTDPDYLIKEKHLKSEPVPPSRVNPLISKELDRIVLQALEKAPDRRFLGCGQFLRCIGEVEIPESAASGPAGGSREGDRNLAADQEPRRRSTMVEDGFQGREAAPAAPIPGRRRVMLGENLAEPAPPPPRAPENRRSFDLSVFVFDWLPWILLGASGVIVIASVVAHFVAQR